jgi:signal transduction histidine kinase
MPPRDEPPRDPAARRAAIAKLFAHDLRNPISALSANVSYLQSETGSAGEGVRGAVADCAHSLGVLRHLIDNYVLIARLEAGEHAEAIPMPLRQLSESALRASRELVPDPDVAIRLEGEVPDLVCCVEMPCAALVIVNLLLAAAAHAVGHGGEVALRVTADQDRMRLSVRDSGPRVDAARRGDLLTLDAQLVTKMRPGGRYGRGLGLYAAGLGAGFLGGEAEVGERDGQTEITVTLPIEPPR